VIYPVLFSDDLGRGHNLQRIMHGNWIGDAVADQCFCREAKLCKYSDDKRVAFQHLPE